MRPGLLLAAVCVGWGTIPLLADEVALPAVAIVSARVWVAAAGLGAVLVAIRPPGPRPLSVQPGRSIAAGVVLAVHWTAMFAAYDRAPDATVIFIVFLAPVGIAIAERASRRLVAALAVALAGFALVAGPSFGTDSAMGIAFAAVSAATFVVLVLLSKPLAEVYGGLRLTFQAMVVAGAVLLPIAATSEWGEPRPAWAWLVVLGLVHTAAGTAVYLRTLALLPATEVGIFGYLEPVGVVLFAWLLASDAPDATTVAGGALVVAAGAITILTAPDARATSEVSARVPG